jgi:hypothetical protein
MKGLKMKQKITIKNKEELFIFSTVRIETEKSVGTGFIVNLSKNYGDLSKVCFLVTNKHVIENANNIKFLQHKLDTPIDKNEKERKVNIELGNYDTFNIKLDEETFYFHPDKDIDIAILNLNKSVFKDKIPFFMPIEVDILKPDTSNINLFDDIYFIGYPNGLYDKYNLLPIIRKGAFATPFEIDFENKPKFLIDASVFPGSSGSPVFFIKRLEDNLNNNNNIFKANKIQLIKPKIYFLGIVSSVYIQPDLFDIIEMPTHKKIVAHHKIDIGVVFKSIEIEKLIKLYFVEKILMKEKIKLPEIKNIDLIKNEEVLKNLITKSRNRKQ